MGGVRAGTTAIQLDDGTLQCRKCGRLLGAHLDDGVLIAGGIHIWNEARFSCVACGRVYQYAEDVAERLPNDAEVVSELRHGLGFEFKPESIARRARRRLKAS